MEKAYKGFIRKELPSGEVVGFCMNDFEYHENSSYHTDGKIERSTNGFHSYPNKKGVFKFYVNNLYSEVTIDGHIVFNDMFVSENITIGKWLTLDEFIDGNSELMKEAIKHNPSCIKFISNPSQEIIDYQKNRIFEIENNSKRFTDIIIKRIENNYNDPALKLSLIIDPITKEELASYVSECVIEGKVSAFYETEMHNQVKRIVSSCVKSLAQYDTQAALEKSFCKLFNKTLKDTMQA